MNTYLRTAINTIRSANNWLHDKGLNPRRICDDLASAYLIALLFYGRGMMTTATTRQPQVVGRLYVLMGLMGLGVYFIYVTNPDMDLWITADTERAKKLHNIMGWLFVILVLGLSVSLTDLFVVVA